MDMKQAGLSQALHVLVEGGAGVFARVLGERLVDELVLFVAPKIVGHEGLSWVGPLGTTSMAKSLGFELMHDEHVDTDLMLTARPR